MSVRAYGIEVSSKCRQNKFPRNQKRHTKAAVTRNMKHT